MMTYLHELDDIVACNERSSRALARAITLSQNQFSLISIRCNHTELPDIMIKRLQELSVVNIRRLVLPKSAQTLYTTIQKQLADEQPSALIILGLDSVLALDDLLTSTNHVRDVFRDSFRFPVLLWLNDEVLRKLSRLAPDFNNWLPPPIQFTLPTDELTNLYR